ncbi:aromatic ring-hydroxylating oxygenase subunit alpha [Parafrankia elaeagni]|uniref:aromatic ring-hydroxylating oxygenase subunit alpha n=1 Tax=Parafrankia elaeagni TaxID=222534 RepID=UPI00036F568A|nr:Rieske 2Fe-2S domain-containing protein [Parafrankia elaeagni]
MADMLSIETFEVSMRVLQDPEIYQLELAKLWSRTWVLLAAESEIPNPGDYVTRQIGDDPVIVVRDRDGSVNVMLNVCAHRGMQVCRAEVGNASHFRCVYHGWVYGRKGDFRGAPVAHEQMWGDITPKSGLGLKRARSTTYAGMIFATWNLDGPSLDEFLGDIKWYTDLMFDRSEQGMEAVGPPQRFVIDANWKTAGEQFNGPDGYHSLTLHRSLLELKEGGRRILGPTDEDGLSRDVAPGLYGVDVSANGHGLRCTPLDFVYPMVAGDVDVAALSPIGKLRLLPPPGMTHDMLPEIERRFTPDQIRILAECPPVVGGLFPNVGVTNFHLPMPDGTWSAATSWHAFVPRGVDSFEFINWVTVERGIPEEAKREVRQATLHSLGTSGVVEQDDAEIWPSVQRSARGWIGRNQTLKYQARVGLNKPDDWPGGGLVYEGASKDDGSWNFWLQWLKYMVGEEA